MIGIVLFIVFQLLKLVKECCDERKSDVEVTKNCKEGKREKKKEREVMCKKEEQKGEHLPTN